MIRRGPARLLIDEGIDVCAQTDTADELLRLVGLHRPDVAIVDIRMPPTHTIEGCSPRPTSDNGSLTSASWCCRSTSRSVTRCLLEEGPGAVGYLLRDRVADVGELLDALQRIAAGETVIDPGLVRAHDRARSAAVA